MFDTLLLRPSLHCNTPLYFTTLHPSTLHYTSLHFTILINTSLPLIYTSLPCRLVLRIYISYRSISLHITSHHITRHSTVLIPKIISKKVNPFTAIKNFSLFHFNFYFIYLFTHPIYPTLHFTLLFLTTSYFPSPHFPSLVYTFLTLVLKICVLP